MATLGSDKLRKALVGSSRLLLAPAGLVGSSRLLLAPVGLVGIFGYLRL